MIQKTKNYEMFILRDDNREKGICKNHVKRLVESIKARNLLELRPITVNKNYEVLDGQHRLEAAKILKVDIYYEQRDDLHSLDIITMNVAKAWGMSDFLNYYCKNGYKEYQKLKNFMEKHNLNVKIALMITCGSADNIRDEYRSGKFIFPDENYDEFMDYCWDTIRLIKKLNGHSAYTSSARFWISLIKLVSYPGFRIEKWLDNLKKMSEKMCAKATQKDYYKLMQDIYNWRNEQKIDLLSDM
jgi:hypothetical protein